MNEAQTRFNKIDPKLRDAGWVLFQEVRFLSHRARHSVTEIEYKSQRG